MSAIKEFLNQVQGRESNMALKPNSVWRNWSTGDLVRYVKTDIPDGERGPWQAYLILPDGKKIRIDKRLLLTNFIHVSDP